MTGGPPFDICHRVRPAPAGDRPTATSRSQTGAHLSFQGPVFLSRLLGFARFTAKIISKPFPNHPKVVPNSFQNRSPNHPKITPKSSPIHDKIVPNSSPKHPNIIEVNIVRLVSDLNLQVLKRRSGPCLKYVHDSKHVCRNTFDYLLRLSYGWLVRGKSAYILS